MTESPAPVRNYAHNFEPILEYLFLIRGTFELLSTSYTPPVLSGFGKFDIIVENRHFWATFSCNTIPAMLPLALNQTWT